MKKKHEAWNGKSMFSAGFSLVELIVVMAIIGILSIGVITMFTSSNSKVRGAAFAIKADLNQARGEAVFNPNDVFVEFVFNCEYKTGVSPDEIDADTCTGGALATGTRDGYRICFDDKANTPPVPNGSCNDADDIRIKDVLFDKKVQFYNTTTGAITGGPTATNGGATLVNKSGVLFSSDDLIMKPDGTSDTTTGNDAVVVYVPADSGPTTMKANPFSVEVSSTGRIALYRWSGGGWK